LRSARPQDIQPEQGQEIGEHEGEDPLMRLTTLCATLTLAAGSLTISAAPALAAPAWQIEAESSPTNFTPGGTGRYVLHVRNVGNVQTDGSTVSVVDTLPPGMEVTAAGELHGNFFGGSIENLDWSCSGATVVTCTNTAAGLPVIPPGLESHFNEGPTSPLIGIEVKVAANASGTAVDRASVSGGGAAAPAVDSVSSTIGSSPPGFGLQRFSQSAVNSDGSPATQAGSHPYAMTTSFAVNNVPATGQFAGYTFPVAELKNVEVDLPVGFVGNPEATPKCPRALFDEGRNQQGRGGENGGVPLCPADTEIGIEVASFLTPNFFLEMPVYNLVPPPGVPAQFGFAYQERVGFIDAGVRAGAGYGLKVNLSNLVQQGIIRSSLTLWGVPADPAHNAQRGNKVGEGATDGAEVKPLLTMPGSCEGPLTNTFTADSWPEPGTFLTGTFGPQSYVSLDNQGNPFAMQDCEKLDFSPSITARPETTVASSPSGLAVDLHVPQNESPSGLAEANLKDAVVTLPAGMTVSPSQANGLQACSEAQIGLNNASQPSCPDASKIGTVEVDTPLLTDPLKGSVYVAQQGNLPGNGSNPFGSLLAIYVTAQADGALIKLAGQVSLAPDTGQITTTFTNNPQLPFTEDRKSVV
jgi:uncharacterized repeat protein (TIGR01451 family)